MKIIIVGALRYSNFGDILFAKLFYEKIQNTFPESRILLYETCINQVSEFCRNELGYTDHFKLRDLADADILAYISGGYFSNSFENTCTKVLWHIRYALPGWFFSIKRKSIYIIGVGGGDYSWKISSNITKKILNAAKYVSVRNQETKDKFVYMGVTNDIHVTSDTAQVVRRVYGLVGANDNNKIFLHIMPDEKYYSLLEQKVFPAIKKYLEIREDVTLLIGFDSMVRNPYYSYVEKAIIYFGKQRASKFEYLSIDNMISTLKTCKSVITPKLHVGIIAASFNKPVISFPINYEKTKRYYKNIGYSDRCIDVRKIDKDIAFNMIMKYIEVPVIIEEKTIEMAEENLRICSYFE